ncbi:MAG TPA: ATP-binding cassette domain-containing protein, partial [Nocardioidaceae bacterium]|nr:ATP-binding cassette domain-containing protein [Nocardioidaceae bacterium]
MGHVDVANVRFELPDGRVLLDDVSFRVGEGAKVALVGANGAGKTTLLRIITGDLAPHEGVVTRTGGLGVMRQMVTHGNEGRTVHDLLLSVSPPRVRAAAADVEACELAMMENDDEATQMRYAAALAEWADAGGYDVEVTWDVCCTAALGISYDKAKYRDLATLSGGEQKRLVLEFLLRGPDEVLLLDEPDNFLDVPGKSWLEQRINESPKTILYISHDRELLANTATRVVTVELGAAGNTAWVHPGGFASYHQARKERFERFEELRRRWDEEHAKLKALVLRYKIKAEYNDGMASQYRAAQTRLRKFEEAGPPQAIPREQQVTMRLRGGRTGKRAVICEQLELTGLMKPFDLEVWYGERVAVLGSNGSGKSHFLRLLAAGGTDPDVEHRPVGEVSVQPVRHHGRAKLGARVRPGWFVQTHEHPELVGRTLLEILHRGDEHRDGMPREPASRALDRYELSVAAEQRFESLSGGQQARFQILLLELSGAT